MTTSKTFREKYLINWFQWNSMTLSVPIALPHLPKHTHTHKYILIRIKTHIHTPSCSFFLFQWGCWKEKDTKLRKIWMCLNYYTIQIFKTVDMRLIFYHYVLIKRDQRVGIEQSWSVKVSINQSVGSAQGRKRMTWGWNMWGMAIVKKKWQEINGNKTKVRGERLYWKKIWGESNMV